MDEQRFERLMEGVKEGADYLKGTASPARITMITVEEKKEEVLTNAKVGVKKNKKPVKGCIEVKALSVSVEEAKALVKNYLDRYPDIKKFVEDEYFDYTKVHGLGDKPMEVDYRDLWYNLYELVVERNKATARLMEEFDPSLLDDEEAVPTSMPTYLRTPPPAEKVGPAPKQDVPEYLRTPPEPDETCVESCPRCRRTDWTLIRKQSSGTSWECQGCHHRIAVFSD